MSYGASHRLGLLSWVQLGSKSRHQSSPCIGYDRAVDAPLCAADPVTGLCDCAKARVVGRNGIYQPIAWLSWKHSPNAVSGPCPDSDHAGVGHLSKSDR
jgi:hypothetical protein